ncbi:wall associated kinase [Salix suchowensis]|nr:wall associated kinase [Salix suchowensis]
MYATRPLSVYKRNPSALSSPPPEGSNSGILIIKDEEDDLTCYLPFPQNKNLTITTRRTGNGKNLDNKVIFIPVLNQPLSSNRYYLIENLRARLPDFNLPLSQRSSAPVVVGSLCCPFMFIKEGKLKDQMSVSRYYGMKLEQRWEQIFASEYNSSDGHSVAVNAVVQRETAAVAGREAAPDRRNTADGVMWFRSSGDVEGGTCVGLSLEIVEGMKWERGRGGCLGGDETEVTVERVEEFGGIGGWKKFGCYVLVERFVLTRMDGSLVLTYDFKHTHQIRSKWE